MVERGLSEQEMYLAGQNTTSAFILSIYVPGGPGFSHVNVADVGLPGGRASNADPENAEPRHTVR